MTTHSSAACCSRPTATPTNYEPKGQYQTVANTKCYVTGPSTAKKAIFLMYDIFGYTSQTLQGADILASHGKEPYLVVMPDLLDGEYAQPAWFAAPDAEENKAKIGAFLGRVRDVGAHVKRVLDLATPVKEEYPGVEKWGSIGCT